MCIVTSAVHVGASDLSYPMEIMFDILLAPFCVLTIGPWGGGGGGGGIGLLSLQCLATHVKKKFFLIKKLSFKLVQNYGRS